MEVGSIESNLTSRGEESNLQPTVYKTVALPLSYLGKSFDVTQDKPLDITQDKSFDATRDRSFDVTQDKPFDVTQDKSHRTTCGEPRRTIDKNTIKTENFTMVRLSSP